MPAAIPAIIGAAGAIGSSQASGHAASRATQAQINMSENAIRAQQDAAAHALSLSAPQRQAGYRALAAMMDMTGLDRGGIRHPSDPTDSTEADREAAAADRYQPRTDVGVVGGRLLRRVLPSAAAPSSASQADVPNLADFEPYNFETDPGYQFRMDEGQRALERGAAARGGLLSGGYGRRAIRYSQDYASNEYQRVFDRISTIAGYGNSSGSNAAQTIVNTGQNVGNAMINAGEARASGYIAQGNANSNMFGQLGQLGGYAAQWYQNRGVNSSDAAVSSYLNMGNE